MSTLMGHFMSSQRKREKEKKKNKSRGKWKTEENEEIAEIKSSPLSHLLQARTAGVIISKDSSGREQRLIRLRRCAG